MKKLFAAIRRAPKRSASVLMLAAAIIVPAALFAWGPARTTYTTAQPADHVVFNSITDNPAYGDERQFVQIKEADAPNSSYSTSASLVAGKQYQVYVYYHNNAASNLNDAAHNYRGVATGAYMRAALPATVTGDTKATAYVGAANASPSEVYADLTMKSANGSPVALRYVAGSATIHNLGAINGSMLSDNIITSGVPLGYNKLDGVVPGCNDFSGYVTFKFTAAQPNFTVTKQVREQGATTWQKSVTVAPGKTVEYKIAYTNTGTTTQNNVVLNDTLPKGLTYVAGSTMLVNPANPNGKIISDNVTKGGVNIGNYEPGSNAYLRFSATVPAESALTCNTTSKFTNTVAAETDNGNKQDTADVSTTRTCTPPPVNPVYTCDALAVHKISETDYVFDGKATATSGASIVSYTFNFGDGTTKTVTNPLDVAHSYTKSGNYNVSLTATVKVNGVEKTVTSSSCKATVCVTIPVVTPVYTCDSLTVTKIDRTNFTFKTTYTVKNATYKSTTYVVTDASGKEVSRSTSPTYNQTKVGKYTVQAIVTVTVGGVDKTVTSDNCKKPFEVTEVPATPVYTCDSLSASKISRTDYSFTGKATATGGATATSYTFTFGDGSSKTVTSPIAVAHSYAKAGTYTVKLSVAVSVNGQAKTVTSDKCATTVTVTPEECLPGIPMGDVRCTPAPKTIDVCDLTTHKVVTIDEDKFDSSKYSKDTTDCAPKPITVCELATKTSVTITEDQFDTSKYSKDMSTCQTTPTPPVTPTTPTTPTELPHTGASDNILTLFGAGSLIAAIGYYVASRKALLG